MQKIDEIKKKPDPPEDWEKPLNCTSLRKVPLKKMTHFGTDIGVSLDISSVQVAQEVYECGKFNMFNNIVNLIVTIYKHFRNSSL